MPRIIISIEGVVIKEVQLTRERTTLGRRPYNDVVIDNLAVSGEHAAIQIIDGEVSLEDLNSTNGTFVNGKAIKKQILQNNDTIEVGKYRIKFFSEAAGIWAERRTVGTEHDNSATVPAVLAREAPVSPPAIPAPPAAAGVVGSIKVLSGSAAGREVPLLKPVTKIGKPGVAVAAISRGPHGFMVTGLEGSATSVLNGTPLGPAVRELKDGDLLELAGTRMAFMQST